MIPKITRRSVADTGLLPAHLHPVLRRLYAARGVTEAADLDLSLKGLARPQGLLDLAPALDLLEEALARQWKVLILGDYDADGATATALAVRGLRMFGLERVEWLVPDRFRHGYGLSPELAELAAARGPDLIVTVDNGIAAVEGVARAKALGMRVLVTDHHLPGEALPAADALVDPNRPGDPFPAKHLAGVGVMFYLLLALRARLRDGAGPQPALAELLDLVALGTVADLVPLDRNNRILVEQGLRRIRAGRACAGILALLEVAGRDPGRITTADLGFAVGPRLNAAGRLEDMGQGIACLLADDPDRALEAARRLDGLNRERRGIEAEMQDQAEALLAALPEGEGRRAGITLYDPDWHEGVIGILAARVRERHHRPAVVFARAGDGRLKGSARSVPGLHLRDCLADLDARRPGLMGRFGGHAMAAGLSLREADLEVFAEAFAATVEDRLGGVPAGPEFITDGPLEADHLTPEVAGLLRYGGPWGQAFPPPLFEGRFEVDNWRPLNGGHLRLWLRPEGGERPLEAVAFRWGTAAPPGARVDALYRLDLNLWQGQERLQLILEHLAAAAV